MYKFKIYVQGGNDKRKKGRWNNSYIWIPRPKSDDTYTNPWIDDTLHKYQVFILKGNYHWPSLYEHKLELGK